MEQFIESVRQYPCLWNTTAIEYRDQELKDAAWAEVMKETDLCSVKEVKLKWKKLRDSYRDALKRQGETAAREGAPPSGKKPYPWKYMGLMQFLQPHMSARKQRADPPPPAPSAPRAPRARNGHPAPPSPSPPSSPTPPSPSDSDASGARSDPPAPAPHVARKPASAYLRKRRRSRTRSRSRSPPAPPAPPDPLDIFFNSMCQAAKRLPFVTQIRIKRTLFEAVTSGEEALLAEQAGYAGVWAAGAGAGGTGGAPSTSSSEAADEEERKPAV